MKLWHGLKTATLLGLICTPNSIFILQFKYRSPNRLSVFVNGASVNLNAKVNDVGLRRQLTRRIRGYIWRGRNVVFLESFKLGSDMVCQLGNHI